MLNIYTTCPPMNDQPPAESIRRLFKVVDWSEETGCHGILIFADNTAFDPWVIACKILEKSSSLIPLVAANPVYHHPAAVANVVNSIAAVSRRRVDLNLVTGGFRRHLDEMGCSLDHDQRYERLVEFGEIITKLTSQRRPVTFSGKYYQLAGLSASPEPERALSPRIFISGSSDACLEAQRVLGATRLSYPLEPSEYIGASPLENGGIRLGIIARENSLDAWHIARRRFPVDRVGEEFHDLAFATVESEWHISLSTKALQSSEPIGSYWIYPFRAYQTYCPYIVGDYAEVTDLLVQFISRGASTFILDAPQSKADLHCAVRALELAWKKHLSTTSIGRN